MLWARDGSIYQLYMEEILVAAIKRLCYMLLTRARCVIISGVINVVINRRRPLLTANNPSRDAFVLKKKFLPVQTGTRNAKAFPPVCRDIWLSRRRV
jgi:hypothetical protein